MTIDGTSQPGVEVNGAGAGDVSGFDFESGASGSVIEGLFITGFAADGIMVSSGASNITIGGSSAGQGNVISGNLTGIELDTPNNTVEGNLIGTNAAGSAALGNSIGVLLDDSAGSTIGGTAAGAGNLISGNTTFGIEISMVTTMSSPETRLAPILPAHLRCPTALAWKSSPLLSVTPSVERYPAPVISSPATLPQGS